MITYTISEDFHNFQEEQISSFFLMIKAFKYGKEIKRIVFFSKIETYGGLEISKSVYDLSQHVNSLTSFEGEKTEISREMVCTIIKYAKEKNTLSKVFEV